MRAALSPVRALMHMPRPVVRASSALLRVQAWSVGRNRNSLSQYYPWKPLGKLCCGTKGTLVATQAPSLSPKPCRDTKFMSRCGTKNLCCDRESLCRDPNRPACLGTLSRHKARKLCCARTPVVRSCLSRPPKPGRAPGLKPCRDTEDPVET